LNGDRRILVAMAHPDDESFGLGGIIARYAAEGAEVYLICATNGDVGTVDAEYMQGYSTIAELRLAELQCAAEKLGFKEVITFGYRDSGMPGTPDNHHPDSLFAADPAEVVDRIVTVIRKVRPHIVITFDPYGGYGHPDHIKMYETTMAAFHAAGDPAYRPERLEDGLPAYQPLKLYCSTWSRWWLTILVSLLPLVGLNPREYGRNKDIDLIEITRHSYPIHTRVRTTGYAHIAEEAADCHASQRIPIPKRPSLDVFGLTRWIRGLLSPEEYTFMRAYPPVNGHHRVERDLFEGLTLE